MGKSNMGFEDNRITIIMHHQLHHCLHRVTLIGSVLLLASCASAPVAPPASVESRDIAFDEPLASPIPPGTAYSDFRTNGLQVEDLDAVRKTQRARFYEQQAEQQTADEKVNAILSAAEYYVQANDFESAERTLSELLGLPFDVTQSHRRRVIQAYIAHNRGDYYQAINILTPVINYVPDNFYDEPEQTPPLTDEEPQPVVIPEKPPVSTQQVDALLLISFAYEKLGQADAALHALIKRESALVGAARSETTRYIWQVINAISQTQRESIIQLTEYPLVRNRIEQSLGTEVGDATSEPQQFNRWRDEPIAASKPTISHTWNESSPRSIAVLLPLSSRYSKAANAVKDGISYQHEQNRSSYSPEVRFYDIGDSPFQAPQYYAAAVQSGADFIIGPLGKDYADQVNNYANTNIPSLLLGGESRLTGAVARFAMGPELEGQHVAEKAWKDGHLSAAILAPNDAQSQRTVQAFTQRWLSLGGKISASVPYSPKQYDHSIELKQLFAINQSDYRHSQIRRVLGYRPEFSAYQRQDIDFIFMLADNETGRLVRPQINFFSGSRIPVYATSAIFNGIQDTINNIDLDSTTFPVMPWVMRSRNVSPYAGQLNMLFAMGGDAYEIAGNYAALTNNEVALNGNTGQITINNYGEAVYQPAWAMFRNGEAEIDSANGIDITPIEGLNSSDIPNSNVKGNYNDSNWDPSKGQLRRGAGN